MTPTKYDRKQLCAAIVEHARDNCDDSIFTVMELYEVGASLGAPKHAIKHAVRAMVDDETILKHGTYINTRGGSKPTTYKLNPNPKTKKTSADFQREAKEKIEHTNLCSLRLASALGIPMRGQA